MERLLYLFMLNPESTKTTILLSAWLLSTRITSLDWSVVPRVVPCSLLSPQSGS